MLKNRYQEILVGRTLMSLVRGLISMKKKRSTLLIDDPSFASENYPGNFVSELEILALLRLGKEYEIPELMDLRQFLGTAVLELVSQDWRLSLGGSPLNNLKEVLRKFPELVDADDLTSIFEADGGEFHHAFLAELTRYENLCFENSRKMRSFKFDLAGPPWLKKFYQRFGEKLNQEYSETNELKLRTLLHLLGLSAEDKLKTILLPEEIPFYFFRLISPLYRLQDFLLITQLKRRLNLMGGDYKESSVQYWQLHDNKFENLLLASFEGVISGEKVLFFSHFSDEVSFQIKSPYPLYKKIQMSPSKLKPMPFPPRNLTLLAHSDYLGSLSPYRALTMSDDVALYDYPYPELPGSKPTFYEKDLTKNFYQDALFLPFTPGQVESKGTLGATLDMREHRVKRKNEAAPLGRLPMTIQADDRNIKGFEYWGPFRYSSLGFLALCYGVEGD